MAATSGSLAIHIVSLGHYHLRSGMEHCETEARIELSQCTF